MKSFQEFLSEARSKKFDKALAKYAKHHQKRAESNKLLQTETEPGSEKRRRVLKAGLLPQQGGKPVTDYQKDLKNLRKAAKKSIKKGKSPEKITAKIAAATQQSSPGPYKPAATYNPANVPKPGSVTAHDGSTQKVNWNH